MLNAKGPDDFSARRSLRQRFARTAGLLWPLVDDARAQLAAEWRRHLLTLIGIVWGAASVLALLSMGAGFFAFLDSGFKKTGDRHSVIDGQYTTSETGGARPGRRIALTQDDVERVRAGTPSASVVAAEVVRGTVSARTARRTRSTVVSGATPDLQDVQVLRLGRGRFFDADDNAAARAVAVLGANLVPIFFGSDDPLGGAIRLEGRSFEVIGVLARKGQQLMVNWALHDDMIFIPLRAAESVFGQGDKVEGIYAKPRRLDDIDVMHAEVRAALAPWHHLPATDTEAVHIQSVTEFTEPFRKIAIGLQVLLGFIGTVALAMAGIGVANLMIAIVNDRRMELAVRRACGARRSDVVVQLLVETLVIVLAGGLVGVAVGLGLVSAIGMLPLPEAIPAPQLSPSAFATTFGVLVIVGLAAGLVPARMASRVDPGAAMRVT